MSNFIDEGSPKETYAFIQWKGTDVCMDFHCDCGAHCHFDGDFAYVVKCQHCGTAWEMPHYIKPRKVDHRTYDHYPKLLAPDEDHCDAAGNALPIARG